MSKSVITIEEFECYPPGAIFAAGATRDSEDGINMCGTGKTLHWAAVKGYGDDWAVYCGWDNDIEFLRNYGDKVHSKSSVSNIISVTPEVLAKYRRF